MVSALITHQSFLKHKTPKGHPECAERIERIQKRLRKKQFSNLLRVNAPLAKKEILALAHSDNYIDQIFKMSPDTGCIKLDEDTFMSPDSLFSALRAAGGITKGIDLVLQQKVKNAFCAVRPPGHHAKKNTAMGFCLFNNIAIGALYALKRYSLDRIAVIDFDVHHGNGTQDILWDEKRICFISMHQFPLFPGSGTSSETGGHNNILNIPLKPQSDGKLVKKVLEEIILPKLTRFKPQLILISAGFDGHISDPLANINLTTADYKIISQTLVNYAQSECNNRLVSCLEGGYNLDALEESVVEHVLALMEA